MKPYRVLILEDEERWRTAIVRSFESRNFQVDAASNPEDAKRKLELNLYHLLILDISMVEGDNTNEQGLEFLKALHEEGLTKSTFVIVYSSHGTTERMREAFTQYGVIDFLEKQFTDNRTLLTIAESRLNKKLEINLDLAIRWQGVKTASDACLDIMIRGRRIKRKDPLYERLGIELEDLLCRLFHEAKMIVVRPMKRGKSGAGILKVQPFYTDGGEGNSVVVKFGGPKFIEREVDNYNKFVKNFLGRTTSLVGYKSTILLGGIAYSLLGTLSGEFEDFESFYQKNDISAICQILDDLFLKTCAQWYANPGTLQPQDLTAEYLELLDIEPERLESSRQEHMKKGVQGSHELLFTSLDTNRKFINPIFLISKGEFDSLRSTYKVLTHGDLNANNILIDRIGATWLIDFYRIGPGHILRDFARLDTEIRILLLRPEEASLEERFQMEEALASARSLQDLVGIEGRWRPSSEAQEKCFQTILHLRTLAMDHVKINTKTDFNEYYLPLLYLSLSLIRTWDLPTVQKEHALLSSALLAERILSS